MCVTLSIALRGALLHRFDLAYANRFAVSFPACRGMTFGCLDSHAAYQLASRSLVFQSLLLPLIITYRLLKRQGEMDIKLTEWAKT